MTLGSAFALDPKFLTPDATLGRGIWNIPSKRLPVDRQHPIMPASPHLGRRSLFYHRVTAVVSIA